MPFYEYQCLSGHQREIYLPSWTKLGCESVVCEQCRHMMTRVIAQSQTGLYFEEGRGQWIHNLGHKPVYITSAEQHKKEMKKAKVDYATPKRGMPGNWG